ncbi:diguanylate cyclase [Yoonia sp.]|uniref:diguanylate cyclase n=1 Tax=Yoonia sp. TaxID=2212373 RepID=UPI0025F4B596|nr:diguanylate cyclase [Yoonia sp.]
MALTRMLGLFAAILLLSTGIAFLGYHYLKLASEYRKNNFIHLSETQRAMDYLEEHPKLEKSEIEVLRAHVAAAQAQAIWCVANLSALETRAFHWLGVGSALDICKYDIRTSELLLARLNGLIESNDARHIVQTTPYLVFYFKRGLLRMREDSFAFQPFVDIIEGKLGLLVKISTLIASTGLGLLFSLVAAKLVRAWRSQSDQTIEMQRMAQRFSLAIQASSDGFALFNKERVLLTCNDRYRELSHPNPAFIRDGMTAIEIMNDAADKGFYQTNGLDTADFVSGHVLQMRSDHDDVQLEISDDRHVLVRFSQTEFGDQVITRTNITDAVRNARKQREYTRTLKKAKDAVERQSLTDPLTGLANRRQLDVALHAQMEIGPASLIRIDLDRFKQVNDVLGHDAGW